MKRPANGPPVLNIVKLPSNVNDVADGLRQLATGIEHGRYGPSPDIALAVDGNGLYVFGIGRQMHSMNVIGLLDLGRTWLVNQTLQAIEEDEAG